MDKVSSGESKETVINVEPGICGFGCIVQAKKINKRNIKISVSESNCEMVMKMSQLLKDISIRELFLPVTKNPIFLISERSKCHPSCIIPFAILKAVEVEMGVALPKRASIEFE